MGNYFLDIWYFRGTLGSRSTLNFISDFFLTIENTYYTYNLKDFNGNASLRSIGILRYLILMNGLGFIKFTNSGACKRLKFLFREEQIIICNHSSIFHTVNEYSCIALNNKHN